MDLAVKAIPVNPSNIGRLAQLFNKTNQMNLISRFQDAGENTFVWDAALEYPLHEAVRLLRE